MRVVFATGSLKGGGAERVVVSLANELVDRGYEVHILCLLAKQDYYVDDRVRISSLFSASDFGGTLAKRLRRRLAFLIRLRDSLGKIKPSTVITVHGGGWNACLVFVARSLGIPVIASEHNTYKRGLYRPVRILERLVAYRLAACLTVINKDDLSFYSSFLPNVALIPDPLAFPIAPVVSRRQNIVLAAGRLDAWHQKGFDSLLKVFSDVACNHPGWRLVIAGGGASGKVYLQSLADQLGVASLVDFVGFQDNLAALMQRASIFVLSSRYEGFALVLLEAMSQGCACISYDCPSGPSDFLSNNLDGLLVEPQSRAALCDAICALIDDPFLRAKLSDAARQKAADFDISKIISQWEGLFVRLRLA